MSQVTSVVVVMSCSDYEDTGGVVKTLRESFPWLLDVSDGAGGDKRVQLRVFAGAVNYYMGESAEALFDWLRSLPWKHWVSVTVVCDTLDYPLFWSCELAEISGLS